MQVKPQTTHAFWSSCSLEISHKATSSPTTASSEQKNAHAFCRNILAEAMDSTERVKDLLGQPLQAGQDRERCYWKKSVSDYNYYSHNRKNSLITQWFWFFTDKFALCVKQQSLDFFKSSPHIDELVTINQELHFQKYQWKLIIRLVRLKKITR